MAERRGRPALVVVGGFLGAGKTTLLLRAARLLRDRGLRAAVITNDQAGALVDTRLASAEGVDSGEVAGACFCCRFSELTQVAESLLKVRPDVIFAEPVGSCIDISATVLQPLKQFWSGQFRLAPFSVVVDPGRAAELTAEDADPHLAYLFQKQVAEADIVLFSKGDRFAEVPELPGTAAVRRVSALTGAGVAAWLDEVLSGQLSAGGHLVDVDYARYAAAEAALGWLNWEGELRLSTGMSPAQVVGPLLEKLDAELSAAGARVAHLKVFDRAPTGYIRAGICANGEEPSVEGDRLASAARRHEVVVNLRARGAPEVLAGCLGRALAVLPVRPRVLLEQCFQPSPPVPEHRFERVV
ncbi:MAG: GTP-binding protein [Bryobacteraceae bacterium]